MRPDPIVIKSISDWIRSSGNLVSPLSYIQIKYSCYPIQSAVTYLFVANSIETSKFSVMLISLPMFHLLCDI